METLIASLIIVGIAAAVFCLFSRSRGTPTPMQVCSPNFPLTGDGLLVDALIAQTIAASRARMYYWNFEPETMTLDLETAPLAALQRALIDCARCCSVEYPETDEGYGRAFERGKVVEEAIKRRFGSDAAAVIEEANDDAAFAAYEAHGGPRRGRPASEQGGT